MSETRSPPSWPSRSRSTIEPGLALLGLLLLPRLLAACGDDDCGPGDAPVDGISVAIETRTLTYGGFTSSPNNDCTAPGGPTSLTVEGVQVGEATQKLTLCLPAPDRLAGTLDLGDQTVVQLVDFFAKDGDCQLTLDRGAPPSGTIELSGLCGNGTDPAGYALAVDGTLAVSRSCPGGDDTTTVDLTGRAAVTAD